MKTCAGLRQRKGIVNVDGTTSCRRRSLGLRLHAASMRVTSSIAARPSSVKAPNLTQAAGHNLLLVICCWWASTLAGLGTILLLAVWRGGRLSSLKILPGLGRSTATTNTQPRCLCPETHLRGWTFSGRNSNLTQPSLEPETWVPTPGPELRATPPPVTRRATTWSTPCAHRTQFCVRQSSRLSVSSAAIEYPKPPRKSARGTTVAAVGVNFFSERSLAFPAAWRATTIWWSCSNNIRFNTTTPPEAAIVPKHTYRLLSQKQWKCIQQLVCSAHTKPHVKTAKGLPSGVPPLLRWKVAYGHVCEGDLGTWVCHDGLPAKVVTWFKKWRHQEVADSSTPLQHLVVRQGVLQRHHTHCLSVPGELHQLSAKQLGQSDSAFKYSSPSVVRMRSVC